MISDPRRTLATLLLACALCTLAARAQHEAGAGTVDTVARVPALETFHEIIFPIWHEAWPAGNTARLIELLPRVNSGIEAIASARLPGILREKRKAWDEGVANLKSAGSAYGAAAAKNDSAGLLDAAEKLHARYEALARVTRPVLKEIEDFHVTLYRLYHHELPENAIDKMRVSVALLKTKMEALNKANLGERWKGKSEAFAAARHRLSLSVDALDATLATGEAESVRHSVTEMHSRFEELNAVFE